MRYLVNGVEAEIEPTEGVEVLELGDRKIVRTPSGASTGLAARTGDTIHVSFQGQVYVFEPIKAGKAGAKSAATGDVRAPMPGLIVEVFVEQGSQVASGQKLLILEAMKMQLTITAPFDGLVSSIPAQKGAQIGDGQLLVHIEVG